MYNYKINFVDFDFQTHSLFVSLSDNLKSPLISMTIIQGARRLSTFVQWVTLGH